MTYKPQLFFGFAISPSMELQLKNSDPELLSIFIQNKSEYLHEISYKNQRYLGKFVPSEITDLPSLELINSNILSLAKKLSIPLSKENPRLFSIIQ